MGDRTNIADALEREALAEAARLLSADPDTEPDGEMPEAFSVVLDELIAVEPDDGFSRGDVARAIVGMLQVAGLLTAEVLTDHNTSDGLFTEARRLLDAATPGPWERPSPTANWFTVPQPIQIDEADWGQETQENGAMCGYRIGTLADERAWRYADAELIAAAPRLIAALLERAVTAEADRGEAERRERTAVNLANYHRDVARTAGGRAEHAEAEARQLREAIEDRLRQVLAVHGQFLGDWDEWTSLGALEGYNGLTVTARTALAHLHGRHDDSPLPTMHCVLCETFRVPAVAEGAEE